MGTYIFCLASNYFVVTELLFFNDSGSQIYSNGIVAFEQRFSGSPRVFPFPDLSLIAPFWDVVDIERFGNIFYRTTFNAALLQRAHDQLQELFPSSGNFTPTTLFIVTWDRVAPFGRGPQVQICIHDVTKGRAGIWAIVVHEKLHYVRVMTTDVNETIH